jgi:hypothetical protein
MRDRRGQVLAILIAALAHHVAEQNAALGCIYHVFEGGTEKAEGRRAACRLLIVAGHISVPSFRGFLILQLGDAARQVLIYLNRPFDERLIFDFEILGNPPQTANIQEFHHEHRRSAAISQRHPETIRTQGG